MHIAVNIMTLTSIQPPAKAFGKDGENAALLVGGHAVEKKVDGGGCDIAVAQPPRR
jgi:hypothetical protein